MDAHQAWYRLVLNKLPKKDGFPLNRMATCRRSAFDSETQILLSTAYGELGAAYLGHLDKQTDIRQTIADEVVRQAFLGERNPDILKSRALAAV